MPANAPHRTTSKYSAYSAKSISKIIIVEAFISNHVIVILAIKLGKSFNKIVAILVISLGEALYEFIAMVKPLGISFKLIIVFIVLVCRK